VAEHDFQNLAARIGDHGWAVVPDFIGRELVSSLRDEFDLPDNRGLFRAAAIGSERQTRSDIRADRILWLEDPGATDAQRQYLASFELLRRSLNQVLQIGLFEYECHFARYAPGAFYRRHVDQFIDGGRRRLSTVLYLNADWQAGEGGELRLYLDQLETGHIDVQPIAGTLVAFLSERFPHEVLPARRERLSLAGWFKTR
jgi:SM-20-related protein